MRIRRSLVALAAGAALLISPVAALGAGTYPGGSTGYDVSYNTTTASYPGTPFGFGIVGVTHGKAFTYNTSLSAEFVWASAGTNANATLYMNLNAPVGTTAKSNTSGPVSCQNGPTAAACQAHNYGWNAAQDAYKYATTTTQQATPASIWWLDIETANSWSGKLGVNQATIQGAIDYLNSQNNIRVGIYSTPGMWNAIVGSSWAPTQTNGTPTWLAIGTAAVSTAAAACGASFINGSSNWLVQFIDKTTSSVDQDYAC